MGHGPLTPLPLGPLGPDSGSLLGDLCGRRQAFEMSGLYYVISFRSSDGMRYAQQHVDMESGQFLHSRHVLGNRYGVVPATCWAPRSFCFTHRHQFAASDDNASDCQPQT
jgi:hypothetical protein